MEYIRSWQSPSNIALVKYWGKREEGIQIPANASLSFTLSVCRTETKVIFNNEQARNLQVYLNNEPKESFKPKIEQFIDRISEQMPWLRQGNLSIHTRNTFPYGAGIASSASSMSALALCFAEISQIMGMLNEMEFYAFASEIARLGSGSACRSIYGPVAEWGEHPAFAESSDFWALPFETIHPVFNDFRDTILIVESGEKEVSSSLGHELLKGHPFADQRYQQAGKHLMKLKECLISGNLSDFIDVVEREALMLHSMMMTSNPYFILMKANTLQIIHAIWEYRTAHSKSWCFTLDAGANVHFLYPAVDEKEALSFVETQLKKFCEKGLYICDKLGTGPSRLEI